MEKYEWRKQEKETYLPKNKPVFYEDQAKKYITVQGTGSPDNEEFQPNVEVLYALSYSIRMMPKSGFTTEGYYEYTVYPLEGIWDLDEEGRQLEYLDRNHFIYTLMIRQPDFVTKEVFQKAVDLAMKKKKQLPLEKAKFETLADGHCIQMMHVGSYTNEPESFALMENFCEKNGWVRSSMLHREIYIGDPRKADPEKLKTVLRFKVEKQ